MTTTDPIRERTDVKGLWKITNRDGSTSWRITIDGPPKLGEHGQQVRNQISRTFSRKKDAKAEIDRIRYQVKANSYVEPDRTTTLALACDEWLDGRFSLEPNSRETYRSRLEIVRRHWIAAQPVATLTKAHVTALVRDMLGGETRQLGPAGKPFSPRYVHATIETLSQVLGDLRKEDRVRTNVADLVDLPKIPKRTDKGWSAEDAQRFVASIVEHRLRGPLLVSMCGLRRGEVTGLRWPDIDLDNAVLHVRQSKTDSGIRGVPLPPTVVAGLRKYRRQLAEERLRAGECYQGDGDRLVVDELGREIRPQSYAYAFRKAVERAGVKMINLHGARHTAVTRMRQEGTDPEVIAMYVGHSRSSWGSFSLEHYRDDPTAPELRGAAAALERAYWPPDEPVSQSV